MAEHYTALERGLVDGIVFGTTVYSIGAHELVKYIVFPQYKFHSNTSIMMNLDVWNSLSKDLQDMIKDVMQGIGYDAINRDAGLVQNELQIIYDAGVERVDLTGPDIDWYVNIYGQAGWDRLKEVLSPADYTKFRDLAGLE